VTAGGSELGPHSFPGRRDGSGLLALACRCWPGLVGLGGIAEPGPRFVGDGGIFWLGAEGGRSGPGRKESFAPGRLGRVLLPSTLRPKLESSAGKLWTAGRGTGRGQHWRNGFGPVFPGFPERSARFRQPAGCSESGFWLVHTTVHRAPLSVGRTRGARARNRRASRGPCQRPSSGRRPLLGAVPWEDGGETGAGRETWALSGVPRGEVPSRGSWMIPPGARSDGIAEGLPGL